MIKLIGFVFLDPKIKGIIREFICLFFILLSSVPVMFLFAALGMPMNRERWVSFFFGLLLLMFFEVIFFIFLLKCRYVFFKKNGKYP